MNSWADHKGGDWESGPPEKSENKVVFLAILVQIPWKITRLPCQPSILGHLNVVCWWGDGGSFLVVFGFLSSISTKKQNTQIKRQSWTLYDKTFWIRAWNCMELVSDLADALL